jgi:glycosyltransferase involved in cell wall biosynthesis
MVIRSPIDLSELLALRGISAAERRRERVKLGLREDVPVVLVLAALEPRKRVDLVLRNLREPIAAGRCQLLIGGDGVERKKLEARARALGISESVMFVGHVDDVVEAFKVSDVLVHAATVEGVPQVVVQALAAGIPVAATDMMGLREVHGAPIQIGSATAEDLPSTVDRALRSPGEPVPIEALDQWTPRCVRTRLGALYSVLLQPSR